MLIYGPTAACASFNFGHAVFGGCRTAGASLALLPCSGKQLHLTQPTLEHSALEHSALLSTPHRLRPSSTSLTSWGYDWIRSDQLWLDSVSLRLCGCKLSAGLPEATARS